MQNHFPYQVFKYGYYSQSDYIRALERCSFVIWLGRHESQGIALQEALAMNVPVLVLDALSLFDYYPTPTHFFPDRLRGLRTTAAPYFDDRCGIILDSVAMLEDGIFQMRERWHTFRPRDYLAENLALDKQAREFVTLFHLLGQESSNIVALNADSLGSKTYKPRLLTRLWIKSILSLQRLTRI
jgi:hypothetical protein